MTPPDHASQGRQSASTTAEAVITERQQLRRQLQAARAHSARTLPHAQHDALRLFLRNQRLTSARRVALYYAVDTEFPTAALIAKLRSRGQQVYLPRIRRDRRLDFIRLHRNSHWQANRYGIAEPCPQSRRDVLDARQLDVIMLPLLGFDGDGQRLGMGGGYYDRSLAFRRWQQHWRRPCLLGLGYASQQCGMLRAQPWDIPLDAILTQNSLTFFKPK